MFFNEDYYDLSEESVNLRIPYDVFKESFVVLETVDSELLDEATMILSEGAFSITNVKNIERASKNIQSETLKLLTKYEAKLKVANEKKYIKKLYSLNKKIKNRLQDMKNLCKRGNYASAIRYIVYTGDVKMIGTWLELSNINQFVENLIHMALVGVTGGANIAAVSIANLVISKNVATSSKGQSLIKEYMSFLQKTSDKIESMISKYDEYDELD